MLHAKQLQVFQNEADISCRFVCPTLRLLPGLLSNDVVLSAMLRPNQDGIYALGKAHMRSTPSLRIIFPSAAF